MTPHVTDFYKDDYHIKVPFCKNCGAEGNDLLGGCVPIEPIAIQSREQLISPWTGKPLTDYGTYPKSKTLNDLFNKKR